MEERMKERKNEGTNERTNQRKNDQKKDGKKQHGSRSEMKEWKKGKERVTRTRPGWIRTTKVLLEVPRFRKDDNTAGPVAGPKQEQTSSGSHAASSNNRALLILRSDPP